MQENLVHKVGFVIATTDEPAKVLLTKSRAGQWRLPSTSLISALDKCTKDDTEEFRTQLNLGKTSFVNNVFFRDSREEQNVTRFFALRCSTPEEAQANAARFLNSETKWASFEEASWIVAAAELDVAQWGERLVAGK